MITGDDSTRRKPPKVSFFGHFGSLNPGNESTLFAILSRLRSRSPGASSAASAPTPRSSPRETGSKRFRSRLGSPGSGIATFPWPDGCRWLSWGWAQSFGSTRRAFRELKGTDMLIVPGTGLVTDAFGLSRWGPYSLFKWVLMAKLRRCRVLFVSIGAGPIDRTLGRVLVKATLSLADYRSYRDDASRDYLRRNRVSGPSATGSIPIWSSACRRRCCRATTLDRTARGASWVSG